MARSPPRQGIPTKLTVSQFEQFVLPHLSKGSRGPATKLNWHAIFNYILRSLYLGCQWKELPIEKDRQGRPEIHYTRIYRAFRRWQADGCFDAIFEGSVFKLHQDHRLGVCTRRWQRRTCARRADVPDCFDQLCAAIGRFLLR
jgi:transposase